MDAPNRISFLLPLDWRVLSVFTTILVCGIFFSDSPERPQRKIVDVPTGTRIPPLLVTPPNPRRVKFDRVRYFGDFSETNCSIGNAQEILARFGFECIGAISSIERQHDGRLGSYDRNIAWDGPKQNDNEVAWVAIGNGAIAAVDLWLRNPELRPRYFVACVKQYHVSDLREKVRLLTNKNS